MPTETIFIVCGVVAAFVFFACVLTYSDLTWSTVSDLTAPKARRRGESEHR